MTLRFQSTPLEESTGWTTGTLPVVRQVTLDPALREAFLAHGEAAEANLERLFANGGLCVTTGQQPGLLLGPLFTLYKAISAITLSQRLTAQLERSIVPVFWVAGDDHDLAEANHVHVVNLENEVEEICLRDRDPSAPQLPLYKEPLGESLHAVFRRLEESTPDTEFRPDTFEWVRRHYAPDRDFATAFAGALAQLLGPEGLLVFRPTTGHAKKAMAPILMRALEHARNLDEALLHRARELESQGHRVPVSVGDGASTVMIEGSLGRDRLMIEGDRYFARRSRESWTLRDLEAIGESQPERLSPNVLLRPAVEAAILPTVTYVAGPGELQYFPQCTPLYEALDVVPQAFVPRWSARVLETRITKVLEKYEIVPEELVPEGRVEAGLVREEMPKEATAALRDLRTALGGEYGRLEKASMAIDPTLKKSVASHRNAALAGVNDVEKRIIAHLKKHNEILVQQIAKARHNLFPHGRPQERVFNVAPYLVRYGRQFLAEALRASVEWSESLDTTSEGA